MDEEDEPTDNDVYIKMRSSVYGVSAEMQLFEDAQSTAAPPNVKRREKPVCYLYRRPVKSKVIR